MSLLDIARFEQALIAPCMAMTERGLRVDEPLRQQRVAALAAEAAALQAQAAPLVEPLIERLAKPHLVRKMARCPTCFGGTKKRLTCATCGGVGKQPVSRFKLGSDTQLKDILYNALKLPRRTRNGVETTDEEALQSLVALDTSGFVLLALRYAKLATMHEIYERLEPAPDGHIRTVFNPAGTYTGRFNSKEAFYVTRSTNLQNLPGSDEARRNPLYGVRDCIVPDVGEVFVEGDLSQAEARVVGCLSEDDALLTRWRDPLWDAHRWTAAHIYDCDEPAVSSTQRYIGKRSRHALNYGEGPTRFWRVINADADITGVAITLIEAKAIYAKYHALHPNLDAVWWNRMEQRLRGDAVVTNCFGRRCQFYPRFDYAGNPDQDSLRAMIAWEPQSTVTHIAKLALLDAYSAERGSGFRVLHEQHDSVLLGVNKHRTNAAVRFVKRVMERPLQINGYNLTIPTEVFVARECWSQKERVA